MKVFLSITITLSLFLVLVLIYIIYSLLRIRTIKKQIKLHKDTTLNSKLVLSTTLPIFLALSTNVMIAIDLILFLALATFVGYAVYLNDEFEKLNKELIQLMEDEKNGTMESKRSL